MYKLLPSLLLTLFLLPGTAQTPPTPTPGGIPTTPHPEVPVEALTRRDPATLALTLSPATTLLLHDFDFNGDPVPTDKIHLHQLSPGVYELVSNAYTTGFWRFHVTDAAAYYGLGPHFDTLDHAHTIVRNLALNVPAPRGSTTPAPVPFFLSTSGYGLWLDTPADATFDLNASDPANIIVDASTARLRIVLFTGDPSHPGQFPGILAAFATLSPSAPTASFFAFEDLPGTLTGILSATLSGLPLPGGTLAIPATPDPFLLSRWLELLAFTPAAQSVLPEGTPANLAALAKRYASIHESFGPYFATHKTIQPLVLAFQDDPQTRTIKDEYLLGPSLLVAPALDQNSTRLVYLPAGEWRNLFTNETFTGPQTVVASTPSDSIPIYVRPNANFPRLSSESRAVTSPPQ